MSINKILIFVAIMSIVECIVIVIAQHFNITDPQFNPFDTMNSSLGTLLIVFIINAIFKYIEKHQQ